MIFFYFMYQSVIFAMLSVMATDILAKVFFAAFDENQNKRK